MSEIKINIIITLIATACSIFVALLVMWITNKYNRKLQNRNEQINRCTDIEILVAEYSPILHKLFAKSRFYRKQGTPLDEMKLDESGILYCKDEIDKIIFKVQMKTRSIKELEWLVGYMENLKVNACSGIADVEVDYRPKTKVLRTKLAESIDEHIKSL